MKCKVLNAFLVTCLYSVALYGCTLKLGSDNSEKTLTSKEITQTTVQSTQSPNTTEIPSNWQGMGHGMRVQGVIVKLDKDASTIKSFSLKVTNNLLYSGNPVDYDFKGETVDISFENGITDSDFIRQIKNGGLLHFRK